MRPFDRLTTPDPTVPPRLRPRKPQHINGLANTTTAPPAPPSLTDGDPLFLKVREVAVKLHISDETVKRMVRRGELRGRRIGRCWRVETASLREWLAHG